MKKFVSLVCNLIDLYIYFVVICCFMTWIPNLNVNFPAIKIMFWLAGFNILSNIPFINMFVPLIMVLLLISLRKFLYKLVGEEDKFFGYNTTCKNKQEESDSKEEGLTDDNQVDDSTDAND